MKFLCVSCQSQMKLIKGTGAVTPDEHGSLTMRYECPDCLVEIAMFTNAFETQLVSSLGVEIGGQVVEEAAQPAAASKCPFSQTARQALAEPVNGHDSDGMQWTAQALVRLQNIPEFVRPMARQGIEKFALERGFERVDERCLDEAKDNFGM